MKKLLLALMFGLISTFIYASPFGLKMSMTFVTCNDYGAEIQNEFNSVKDRIAKTYGKSRIINKVDSSLSEYMRQDKWWFNNLKNGAQQVSAIWGEKTDLADDLSGGALDCVADNEVFHWDDAHLVLYCYFNNASSVEDEQDEIF